MVWAAIEENDGNRNGVIPRVARQLGVGVESLRGWVNQAEVDRGSKPGTPSEERRRINELEREVRELRRANEILKAAATFSAGAVTPSPRAPSAPRARQQDRQRGPAQCWRA